MSNYKALRAQLNSLPRVQCMSCGLWYPPRRIEIHHADGDRQNDDPANHRILCKRCHRQRTNLRASASISA